MPLRPYRDIPSPSGHPLLGVLPDWLGKRNAFALLDTLQGYEASCGELARIDLGPMKYLLVSDPALIEAALSDAPTNVKGWSYALTRVVLDNVLLLNGEPWSRHRKKYRDALKHMDALGAAARCAEDHFERGDDHTLDAAAAALDLMADVCSEMLCGERFPVRLHEARERIQHELAAVGIDMQCQPWTYASPLRWWRLSRSIRAMRTFFMAQVDNDSAVLSALREQGDKKEALCDALVNLFFTAHDVTTNSLTWMLSLLAQHPEWQEKIVTEASGVDLGCAKTLAGLDALNRCARESLRLYPGYPLFARRTTAPLALGGYEIPSGVELLIVPRVVHRSPRYWGAPMTFDPDRWPSHGTAPGPAPRGGYLPFGGGYRGCIAYRLAFPMLMSLTARLLSRYTLTPAGPTPEERYWGSIYPAGPLMLRLQKRGVEDRQGPRGDGG